MTQPNFKRNRISLLPAKSSAQNQMHISAKRNEYRGRKGYYFKTFTAGVGFPSIRGIEAIVLDMSSITSIFVAQTVWRQHSIQPRQ